MKDHDIEMKDLSKKVETKAVPQLTFWQTVKKEITTPAPGFVVYQGLMGAAMRPWK